MVTLIILSKLTQSEFHQTYQVYNLMVPATEIKKENVYINSLKHNFLLKNFTIVKKVKGIIISSFK